MQKNNISLRLLSVNDNLEGLKVLQNILQDETSNNESTFSCQMNEELYKKFLLYSELDKNKNSYCYRYWILLDDTIIGYADIKRPLKSNIKKRIGNIGMVLIKEYRNKGFGLITLKLLIEKAKNEFNMKKILIVTGKDNISMRKLCENTGFLLEDISDKCRYIHK